LENRAISRDHVGGRHHHAGNLAGQAKSRLSTS
jgi:hypothetical protein